MASLTWEIGRINLKYAMTRLRDERRESELLSSIAERGVEESVEGIVLPESTGEAILLDGFKRVQCAKRLGLGMVPWCTIASSETDGIAWLLTRSVNSSLHILEQARLVDELRSRFQLTNGEIAKRLGRSAAWVSVRLGMLSQMSPTVRELVFSGKFSVRAYLYTVRHFTRVKRICPREVEEFVQATASKRLSTRQLEILARGYFDGGNRIREEIRQGHFDWSLKELRGLTTHDEPMSSKLTEVEVGLVRDLEIANRALGRIVLKSGRVEISSPSFRAEAGLLCGGILSRFESYRDAIERLHAQCRKKEDSVGIVPTGSRQERDCAPSGCRSEDSPELHQGSG